MPGGKGKIKPEDGKQFSSEYQPDKEKWTEKESLRLLNDLINWMKESDENIFFEDFLFLSCNENDYAGSIYPALPAYLSNKYTSCLNLIEKARKIQEVKLKKFGSFDKLNSSIVKFLLSAEHGLTEKKEIDVKEVKEVTGYRFADGTVIDATK